MTKSLSTVKQAMELSIQHHVSPDQDSLAAAVQSLEAHLDTLPPAFAAALRVEMTRGSLVVTLVPDTDGIRVSSNRPRGRRPKPSTQP